MNNKSSYLIKKELLNVIAKHEYALSKKENAYNNFEHFQYQFDRVIKFLGFNPDDLNNIRYYGSELKAFDEFKKGV